ncbi:MAG: hypothetical protein J5999_06360 [Oscillospiraceae bacterium]|nr:hypothetical protein [Oscillospiraceae bacterium]
MIVGIVTAAVCVILFIMYERLRRKLHAKTDYLRRPEIRCEAEILDVNKVTFHDKDGTEITKKAAIISFRSGNSTTVHRYTRKFFRPYRRGDKIVLYYDSETDEALIERDNPAALADILLLPFIIVLVMATVLAFSIF